MSEEYFYSNIWQETAEADNPFVAARCYCAGYDVYADLLGQASWIEYLYLLFKLERPSKQQAKLLETLAVAIANQGPREHSVQAASCAGVGGSTAAASLMAALAVGAGQLGGAREVFLAIQNWQHCGTHIERWQKRIHHPSQSKCADIWPKTEHFPGFDPHSNHCATPVLQTLQTLAGLFPGHHLSWLLNNRCDLENSVGSPLAMTGLAAATFADLEMSDAQGEMLFLLLRLPGAAAHSLEQQQFGWRKYPFFKDGLELSNDPGPHSSSAGDAS